VARNLAPGGRAVAQSIVIRDDLFARYRKGTDFIQQMVFPGGMLPSISAFREQAGRAGLEVREAFAFGRDYARTLAEWAKNFEAAWPQIARLGFDERFRRLWRFYLAYCEAGFAAGSTDVVQFELAHAR
jgi:cyclopropane-fatty-acyl-phospholipid synthase